MASITGSTARASTQAPNTIPIASSSTTGGGRQGGFRTDWDINSNDSLTIQGDLYDGVSGENVRISSLNSPYVSNVEKNAQLSGGNLLARWQRKLKEGFRYPVGRLL